MSFLTFIMKKSRLSDITIDVDKDWQAKGITNIKQVAALMSKGDVVVKDTNILARIAAGPSGYVLTSQGAGQLPAWAPAGGALKYYFPVSVYSSKAALVVPVDRQVNVNPPSLGTSHDETTVPTLTPSIASSIAAAIAAIDQQANPNPVAARQWEYWVWDNVSGAVADDGGEQTDETAAAINDTLNDMTLLPATPAVDDAYYFAYSITFPALYLKQDTLGGGVWAITWEYWNGAWVGLAGVNDPTNGFRPSVAGTYRVSWTDPGDWAQTNVAGLGPFYWVRARVSSYTSTTTQPKGTRVWAQTAGATS